jgi:hypothetical protein
LHWLLLLLPMQQLQMMQRHCLPVRPLLLPVQFLLRPELQRLQRGMCRLQWHC